MHKYSSYLTFRIDPSLSTEARRSIEHSLANMGADKIISLTEAASSKNQIVVDFYSENSLHQIESNSNIKICWLDKNQGLFSFGQNIDQSNVDVVLDEDFDFNHISHFVADRVLDLTKEVEKTLIQLGNKNYKKLESKIKNEINLQLTEKGVVTSAQLLEFNQSLVDLEKELIHTPEITKIEKHVKSFVKNHFEKSKINFITAETASGLKVRENVFILPRYQGEFLAFEFNWEDSEFLVFVKKILFIHTLLHFFESKQTLQDPFLDEVLWENLLDSLPFPVALLSQKGEVYQHNTLFSKLNVTPSDCLEYKLKEKVLIQEIPYNVFRKEIYHLDDKKILFVFFTESFFLKGDGNLTPSGQELGIISSSIAHELNNPIAGIQAALSVLLLNEELDNEAKDLLEEMKNGANRCKQLIETFLGFSRARPNSNQVIQSDLSAIEICYQQAQNLLRFRTVESGIRFNFEYSKHSEFRSSVNPSLLTMTFYLLLGELMTLYSHHLLVADKNQIEKVIRGEIIESSQEIQIQLKNVNISTLSLSKLIQNLLNIENFVLQVSDYSLRFIYNPSRRS